MSDITLIKQEIINAPENYFNALGKTLDERLKTIQLPEEVEKGIINDKTKKTVRDKILGLFKVGEVISTVLNWNDDIDKDIKEAKKEFLMLSYFEKQEDNQKALTDLKMFLTSAQGNTLFNKILRILDDSPPDIELSKHLGNSLKYIVGSKFEELFEKHKYALSQIEKLSPQALSILSDCDNYPLITLNSFTASGPRITSDWLPSFAIAYSRAKNVTRQEIIERISHSTNELINNRFIEALQHNGNQAKCVITNVGSLLIPYLK
ncbi:MAG: hypothetical protein HYZ10_08700 [Ignavibacteriales bacterium]|nr:hypothetical protein [Ignavibacteriales bacterium]